MDWGDIPNGISNGAVVWLAMRIGSVERRVDALLAHVGVAPKPSNRWRRAGVPLLTGAAIAVASALS